MIYLDWGFGEGVGLIVDSHGNVHDVDSPEGNDGVLELGVGGSHDHQRFGRDQPLNDGGFSVRLPEPDRVLASGHEAAEPEVSFGLGGGLFDGAALALGGRLSSQGDSGFGLTIDGPEVQSDYRNRMKSHPRVKLFTRRAAARSYAGVGYSCC